MTRSLDITVVGTPGAQGSKVAGVSKAGKAYVREANASVRPWRQDVMNAALAALHDAWWGTDGFTQGPVELIVIYYMRRPVGHFSQRQDAEPGQLKDSAPRWHYVKPDVDKLERATRDALTLAGVYRDDSQVARGFHEKHYADTRQPGALIRVRSLLDGKEPSDREDAP